jgi:hypothetical protein
LPQASKHISFQLSIETDMRLGEDVYAICPREVRLLERLENREGTFRYLTRLKEL